MAGAMTHVNGLRGSQWLHLIDKNVVMGTIASLYGKRYGETIASFNDHPETTWAMVEEVMEKAAIRGDELVDEPTQTDWDRVGEQL